MLKRIFQYCLEGKYLTFSSDGDYATIPSEHDVLILTLTKSHMFQVDTALY